MTRVAWTGGIVAAAITVSAVLVAATRPSPTTSGRGAGALVTERIAGVRTTAVTHDGHRVSVTARTIESPPVRLLGPVRLGFLRSAVASDVRIQVDARHLSSDPGAAGTPPLGLDTQALGLRRGNLAGLEIDGLDFRLLDPIGRTLTVRARRCEMESPQSLLCFKGALSFGAQETLFARARFDGRSWQVLESPTASARRESAPGRGDTVPRACMSAATVAGQTSSIPSLVISR